jgi:hypothetical protein
MVQEKRNRCVTVFADVPWIEVLGSFTEVPLGLSTTTAKRVN